MKVSKYLVKIKVAYVDQYDKLRPYDYFAQLSTGGMLHIYNIGYPIKYGEKEHFFRAKLDPWGTNKDTRLVYEDDVILAFKDRCSKLNYPGFKYWHELKSISVEIKIDGTWYDFVAMEYKPDEDWTEIFTRKVQITDVRGHYAYQWAEKIC